MAASSPRVGLVLGGGGVLGAAWLMGTLAGLVEETGWDPEGADIVVGTSAGSVVAGLIGGATKPWRLVEDRYEAELVEVLGGAAYRIARPDRLWRWGSWRMVLEAWRGGGDAAVARIWAGLLPEGLIATDPIERMIDERVERWPSAPELWVVATDYESGERQVFGRPGSPSSTVGRAVAASCAIPGFYQPVRIGSRRYVDGGVTSSTNVDLLAGRGLHLVLCLVPLSPATAIASRTQAGRFRALLHGRLLNQLRVLEREGAHVLLVEPDLAATKLIGLNFMNRSRAAAVARAATEAVADRLGMPDAVGAAHLLGAVARERAG